MQRLWPLIFVLLYCSNFINCLPTHTATDPDQEIIVVEEVMRITSINPSESNATTALLTLIGEDENEEDEEGAGTFKDDIIEETGDELIKPQKRSQLSTQRNIIDLIVSDEEEISSATTILDNIKDQSNSNNKPTPSVDLSDFIALIPVSEVRSIAARYYHNDAEVQRAYAYLQSRDFLALRQRVLVVPETIAFLGYLNSSGLNLVNIVETIVNLTLSRDAVLGRSDLTTPKSSLLGNEIEKHSTTTTTVASTTPAELNGLHGLVDSVLDILPQDQILSTFFDKLESDERFAHLVDSIGNPKFAKILSNMQNSVALRNLIFTLHNNGIYITRIVDSLKAYFFLGTF